MIPKAATTITMRMMTNITFFSTASAVRSCEFSSLQIEMPRRRQGMASTPDPARSLLKPLARRVGRAIQEFRLIEDGDRILCAMSGGKDSYAMLHLLDHLRRRAPVRFELVAVTVDQGYRGFRTDVLERYFKEKGYAHHIERTNIAEVIDDTMPLGDTHCSMCARLRRGVLYRLAPELGCNKIALGTSEMRGG